MGLLKDVLIALASPFAMFYIASALYPRYFPTHLWRWQITLFSTAITLVLITARLSPPMIAASISAWLTAIIALGLRFPGSALEGLCYEREHKKWTKRGAIAAGAGVALGWILGYTRFVSA